MFGHLDSIFADDRQLDIYRCSLCHALAAEYGPWARFFTNNDMALCLLVCMCDSLPEESIQSRLCPLFRRHRTLSPKHRVARYLAAISVLLVREKAEDDYHDERRTLPSPIGRWLERKSGKARSVLKELGFDSRLLTEAAAVQRKLEAKEAPDLASLVLPTAQVTESIYRHLAILKETPNLEEVLGSTGRAMGVIVYLLDSFADYQEDLLTGSFNPLHCCFFTSSRRNGSDPIASGARHAAEAFISSARLNMVKGLTELPLDDSLRTQLLFKLGEAIDRRVNNQTEAPPPGMSLLRSVRLSSLPCFASPGTVYASPEGGPNGCGLEPLIAPLIMLGILIAIVRGCCRPQQPGRVTVDHGCDGRKTYRLDPCTGRYRDDSCC